MKIRSVVLPKVIPVYKKVYGEECKNNPQDRLEEFLLVQNSHLGHSK
jgi:hypothetical protein